MKTVTLTTQISKADFVKVTLLLAYRKPVMIAVSGLMFLFLVANALLAISTGFRISMPFLPPLAILLGLPAFLIFAAIKGYNSSKVHQAPIVYTFDEESLYVQAEKAESRADLSTLVKVQKLKGWLLIYKLKGIANVVPLGDVSNDQLHQLKDILTEAGVRNNL